LLLVHVALQSCFPTLLFSHSGRAIETQDSVTFRRFANAHRAAAAGVAYIVLISHVLMALRRE
jgi:hypothetical protein